MASERAEIFPSMRPRDNCSQRNISWLESCLIADFRRLRSDNLLKLANDPSTK